MEIREIKSFLEKRRKKGSIMKKETLVLLLSHEINTHVSLKMMEQQENEKIKDNEDFLLKINYRAKKEENFLKR